MINNWVIAYLLVAVVVYGVCLYKLRDDDGFDRVIDGFVLGLMWPAALPAVLVTTLILRRELSKQLQGGN